MTRLTWTKQQQGWQSGRYRIELAAPGFWVLTRQKRRTSGDYLERIEETGGSLSMLKGRAAELEARRVSRSRSLSRFLVLMIAILAILVVSDIDAAWARIAVIGISFIGSWALLSAIDSLIRRPWESIRAIYQ